MPLMRRIILACAVFLGLAVGGAFAQDWGGMATISTTMGVQANRLCVGEGTRGDIGCPTYAPSLTTAGDVGLTGGLTTSSVSLTTLGTTWGYLGAASSYIPNLASNAISTTNISLSTINGVSISSLGGGASPTNVPSFRVSKGGTNQTVTAGANTKITFSTKTFDTTNNFNTSTSRFTPNVAGNYIFVASAYCPGTAGCLVDVYKNGAQIGRSGQSTSATGELVVATTVIIPMNGTTDYVEVYANSASTTISGADSHTFFAGSLLASGNGLVSGTGVTMLSALSDVNTAGAISGSLLSYDAGQSKWVALAASGGLGYAITSGTTAVTVNSDTSLISLTTAGTTWGYLGSAGSYLPKLTTGSISTTTVQVSGTTATCGSTNAGTIRYTSATTTLELCTGSSWQPIGVGIPAGTISAFASTTCPTGWSEYTPARGRFLRGIDNAAGNDPSGTRLPGDVQDDLLKSHTHSISTQLSGSIGSNGSALSGNANGTWQNTSTATGGAETRPKNVAVTFCQFNGTSNGWNNPLSGGSTSAAGSTSQIQYNTSGSFDANAGLTWTNATQTLFATNISTTNISATTINGVPISSLGSGSASPTNVPAFSVNRNNTDQTSIPASTPTKITFSNKVLDNYNSFNTSTSRYTPTVAGNYIFSGSAYCSPAGSCYVSIYKNGTQISMAGSALGSGTQNLIPNTSIIIPMNGTTDYVELYIYMSGSTTLSGTNSYTYFSGSLLASGNGLISGSGAGVSAMSSLTDVMLTAPTSNSILVYDGTKWVNKFLQDTVSTTTMVPGWPDAIRCNITGTYYTFLQNWAVVGGGALYRLESGSNTADMTFSSISSAGVSGGNYTATGCNTTIANLYAAGQAFNFIGGSGNASSGYGLTSGTLGLTLNSPTSIISLSTAGTTWGYLGSTASYLPNLSSNAISTTNISLSTINGQPLSSFGGSASPTNVPAFRANKNGVDQTGVAANTWTKLTFTNEEFDTYNNYDAPNSRFTPTIAGNYQINLSTYCGSSATNCYVAIYKNGTMVNAAGLTATGSVPSLSSIVKMNGTTDYIEAYVSTAGSTTINSLITYTNFSGSLMASGNGLVSGTGAGVSAMSSLTDVTLTSPVANSMLVYDGTKWVNKLIQDTVSTSTMVNTWPDAIMCTISGSTDYLFPMARAVSGGGALYKYENGSTVWTVTFSNISANGDQSGSSTAVTNCTTTISSLYASGRAFNFIGGAGSANSGYGLTSGTLGLTLNSPTSIISLSTAGTTWGYLGSAASYLPNLSSNAISTTNISATTINGILISSLGSSVSGSSSATVAFSVNKGGTNQTVVASTATKLTFSTKSFDTNNNFDTGTSRFTPTVAGKYFITMSAHCPGTAALYCQVYLYKNGTQVQTGYGRSPSGTGDVKGDLSIVVDMNGTTDYLEAYGQNGGGTAFSGAANLTHFDGFLINGGGSGGSSTTAGLGDTLTSGTLSVVANSNTSVVSLSTVSTTWGYLGSAASYLPNFSSNAVSTTNISATTINGIAISSLGSGASPTNVPAFSVHKGGTGQTSIASNTWTKVTFSTKIFDNLNSFNTSTSRFQPNVAGTYLVRSTLRCVSSATTTCYISFYKNGVQQGYNGGVYGDGAPAATAIMTLNGTTDYVEVYVYTNGSSVSGAETDANFAGSLLASGNGTVSGTGAGVSAMSSLSDVSFTGLTAGQTLTYNGTTWINTSSTVGVSSPTNVPAFRVNKGSTDQTVVANTWTKLTWGTKEFDTYSNFSTSTNRFTPTIAGKYIIAASAYCQTASTACVVSIYKNGTAYNEGYSRASNVAANTSAIIDMNGSTDYLEVYAYNEGSTTIQASITRTYFSGSLLASGNGLISGSTASGDAITSSTLAVTANGASGLVSLSTAGTTWGYLGSTGSYLPNINSTNISVSTINGISASNYIFASSTLPVFKVNKNGTGQSIPATTWTKLTFSTKEIDTNNSFNTSTSRYTPTVAGNYMFSGSVYCTGATCWAGVYKNGVMLSQNGSNSWAEGMPSTNVILAMNGSTDYVELYAYSAGNTASGSAGQTHFEGFLLGGGGSGVSGTGTGVSSIASLTDVTLTNPSPSSILMYDGTKWVNKYLQDTVSTTTMVTGWPDAIYCSNNILYLSLDVTTAPRYQTYNGPNVYRVVFNMDKTFSASQQITAGTSSASAWSSTCDSKTIPQLYASGNAFNFLGTNAGINTDYAITSGTLAVTTNSNTSIVSLTTGLTTWGYMGSTASYLPNFSSNAISTTNISATTINGIAISSLGSGGAASATNVPAFKAYNGSNFAVTAATWTKIAYPTKDFDNFNNYNTATGRFTPTVSGTYIFTSNFGCQGTNCQVAIYKNGVLMTDSGYAATGYPHTVGMTQMNGTTDYVEVYGYSAGSTAVYGQIYMSYFEGSLLASGNGTSGGGGAGVSAMASLTDVSLTGLTANNVVVYDGTKWVNKFIQDTISSTSQVVGWPDAIYCNSTSYGMRIMQLNDAPGQTGQYGYRDISGGGYVLYTAAGAYSSQSGMSASGQTCISKSISQLYAAGQAFNYLGGTSIAPNLDYALVSGTLGLTLNSPTSIISLTSGATTWGYLGSTASYLPNLSSNAISTTNISVTTINGLPISSFASGASPTNVPAFRVNRNNVAQSGFTTALGKILFTTKEYDTFGNYDLGTNRFQPTVAGNYLFVTSAYCTTAGTSCYAYVTKNGTIAGGAGSSAVTDSIGQASVIIPMNGTTDYVEASVQMAGSTSLSGTTYYTYFMGSLIASGNGTVSSTGAGVSAIASLTDVTLTNPSPTSILMYDGSKWVNKYLQDTVSTSTMVTGWPDTIRCTVTSPAWGEVLFYPTYMPSSGDGRYYYRANIQNGTNYAVIFTSAGAFAGYENLTTTNCNTTVSSLYSAGRAYNFIGNSASGTGLGYALTSGTLAVTANSNTSVVSFTTAGTTWGYLGSTASYIPNLSTNALTVGGLNLTSSTLVSSTAQVAFSVNKAGTNQTVTANTNVKLTWSNKLFDTNNNFSTATSRFTPTVAGYYQLHAKAYCTDNTAFCQVLIYKNATLVSNGFQRASPSMADTNAIIPMNGTTDYAEVYVVNSNGTNVAGNTDTTIFEGYLLSGGGSGGISGTLSNSGDNITSGTLAVIANSATSVVSLTTGLTTWGYFATTGSYLPNFSSNAISTTNISVSTINGISVSALAGAASPTNVPSFRANKGGTAQTVTASVWTKVTFSTKDHDTYTNFSTSTNRFTPTVAGYYLVQGQVGCGTIGECFSGIYKNGAVAVYGGASLSSGGINIYAPASYIVYMNGSTDYLELYGETSGTSFLGTSTATYFQATLVASGNGLISGTGAGVSAIASLTDVTLTNPSPSSILMYDGSKWVNKYLQDTVSSTTMISGFPDAILCYVSGAPRIMYVQQVGTGVEYQTPESGSTIYRIIYNSSTGAYSSSSNVSTYDCVTNNWSISQLYANGRAFNFIGSTNGASALGDRITSGTTAAIANSATSLISLTTGGTTWGYLGQSANYLPNLGTGAVSATTVSVTSVNFNNNAGLTCNAANYGTMKVVNGKPFFCVSR